MKKIILILALVSTMIQAQTVQNVPQISVTGEGMVKVTPDEAMIRVGVESIGKEVLEVKNENDKAIELVLKSIKKHGVSAKDFQTQNVSLHKNYDYNSKKYNYKATQIVSIHLKDLKVYDALLMDLVASGINTIQSIEFKSSQFDALQVEVRKKAILNAKKKAEDYVSVLGQKVGKALLINDNSQATLPQPMYRNVMMAKTMDENTTRETLAIGEIEISATVGVTFVLE